MLGVGTTPRGRRRMGQTHFTEPTRATLLARLKYPHDGDAWRAFADRYGPPVFRYCRKLGLQDADASDVVQEVLAQVAMSIRQFEYDPAAGRFRDWLGAVVRGKLSRHGRKRSPAPAGDVVADLAGPEAEASWVFEFNANLLAVALTRARVGFEPRTWRAFELTWVEDRPAPAVASELGLPVALVYVAKSRVLKRVREELLVLSDDVPHLAVSGRGRTP